MSIDARIELVTYEADGTATLWLSPREKGGYAGQTRMTVLNPHPFLDLYEKAELWGGDSEVYVGDKTFAKRDGYTKLRLVPLDRGGVK